MLLRIRKLLLKIVKPIVGIIGKISSPWMKKKITGEHYYAWRETLQAGDIILSSTFGELSNLINPSPLKHGAIYLGSSDCVEYIGESVSQGVIKKDLVSHLTTKDIIVVLRLNDIYLDKKDVLEAFERYEGKRYDFNFCSENDAYYCFELCASILENIVNIHIETKEILKKQVYTSESFLNSELFRKVIDSREL